MPASLSSLELTELTHKSIICSSTVFTTGFLSSDRMAHISLQQRKHNDVARKRKRAQLQTQAQALFTQMIIHCVVLVQCASNFLASLQVS